MQQWLEQSLCVCVCVWGGGGGGVRERDGLADITGPKR